MAALPYDINTNPTYIGYRQAKAIMKDVATGRRTMALVCSDPGFCKSYETKHILRVEKVPYHECAPSTEGALVRVLWGIEGGTIQHKGRKPAVLVADDHDGMWQRPTIANQMKAVFGSDRRCVIFETPEALKNEDRKNSDDAREKARYRPTIAPPTFGVSIRLACLANVNYTNPQIVAGMSEHFRSLVSKGLDPHWTPNDAEHGGRDVFLLTHWLATVGGSLRSEGYSYEEARRAIEFYVCNVNRLIDIPPRRLSLIAKVIRNAANPTERDEALERMLRPTDQRPKLKLPEPWVQVMLWPQDPPKRREPVEPVQTPTPEPIVQTPEPDPDPDPPTPAPVPDPPVPDPDPLPREPIVQEPDPVPDPPPPEPIVQTPPPDPRDAILDAELPLDADERNRAFWEAVRHIENMGAGLTVWEAAEFIRSAAPGGAYRLFSYMTTRAIINAARDEIERRRSIRLVSPDAEKPDGGGEDGGSDTDTDTENGGGDTDTEGDDGGKKPLMGADVLPVKIAEVQLKESVAEIEEKWGLPKMAYLREDNRWTRAVPGESDRLRSDSDQLRGAIDMLAKWLRGEQVG